MAAGIDSGTIGFKLAVERVPIMGAVVKIGALAVIAPVVLLATGFGVVQRMCLPANAQGNDAERPAQSLTLEVLAFEGVRYDWTTTGGHALLEVQGRVRNTGLITVRVPTVVIVLRDENGDDISEWTTEVGATELAAGEEVPFLRQIPSPPNNLRNLTVRFAAPPGEDQQTEIIKLIEKFNALSQQGLYAEAETLSQRLLEVIENALGPKHLAFAETLAGLAWIYVEQGRYDEAEPLAERSLAIFEAAPENPGISTPLAALAWLYTAQERYDEAEVLYKRSIDINEKFFGSAHPNFARALTNLGELYRREGRDDEAERLFKQSLKIFEAARDYGSTTVPLANLAAIYVGQSRYAETLALVQASLTSAEKIYGSKHPWIALLQNAVVWLYAEQDRYEDALTVVRRTIDAGAAAHYATFRALQDVERSKLITEAESFARSYEVLQAASRSAAAEAMEKVAKRFAAGSGELAAIVRKDQDLRAEAESIDKNLLSAFSKDPGLRNKTAEESQRNRRAEIELEREKLAEMLRERFPDYVALTNPQPLTLQETQKLLADDEAVVAFALPSWPRKIPVREKGYVWVVTNTGSYWVEIPVSAEGLASDVEKLRSSLTFKKNEPFDSPLAHKIYQQTFGPIAEKLKGKTRLSVLADGALTSIPFDLLITSDPQGKPLKDVEWLIDTFAITVIPSIVSLKTMRAKKASIEAKKSMIAFADPVFSKEVHPEAEPQLIAMGSLPNFYRGVQLDVQSLAEELPQLPGTRIEVKKIAENLKVPKTDIKVGLEATETTVKQSKLDDYRVVYFATHGLVAGELEKFAKAKAEPALVLTIPDEPNDLDNGLLEASEVAGLKLDADWVVLSACNTASSDGVGAEPLSGLARAFIYAGGRSLVVSHWDVADEATAELMTNLFAISEEKPTLSHGEMMREAKLSLLEAAKSDYEAHPRFWAPFVVVGEPTVYGAPRAQLDAVVPAPPAEVGAEINDRELVSKDDRLQSAPGKSDREQSAAPGVKGDRLRNNL